jgi:hypothetical protein
MRKLNVLIVSFAALGLLAPSAQAKAAIESFTAETLSVHPLAGAHEDATTAFTFRQVGNYVYGGEPSAVVVKLPPGVVGDLQNVPRCAQADFELEVADCPAESQVGIASIGFIGGGGGNNSSESMGVFNVQPGPGQPAMLGIVGRVAGFRVAVPILVTAHANDGYAVTATTQLQYFPVGFRVASSAVTLWGVPASHARADGNHNWTYEPVGTLPPAPSAQWKPFMQNPTGCLEAPVTSLAVNTAEEPDVFVEMLAESPDASDCAHVPFAPSISLAPDNSRSSAPAGLNVDLTLPQNNESEGRGTAELKQAVVTLPQGLTISPSAASDGLEACTDEQFAAKSDSPATCPPGSVVGEDEVESPLVLSGAMEGKVYLGQPLSTDPTSGRMFRIFQELQGFGLDIKLEGSVTANPQTGQLTATFANLPELPFQDYRMKLKGGPNALLANPPSCGQHTTTTALTPFSAPEAPVTTPSSVFDTSYDGNGAPCPAVLPFAPSAAVSTGASQAGAFSPLSVTFARADGTQPLGRIDATLPQGLLGYVSKVSLCEPSHATAGTCPAASRIGSVVTSAGAGSEPLSVTGSVYLARGMNGYPFMLSVVVPAVAGPYDLGDVVVPVWLQVNSDGSITAVSGSLPSILDGIPLDIRSIRVTVDRPGFMSNPTSCSPLSLTGQATSLAETVAGLSAPFQATGCSSLPFTPSLTAATQGSTSKLDGASLTVHVSQPAGQANIHYVRVQLPKSLPSRLTTLQQACTEAKFAANPAGCPPGSVVGTATAYTPMLPTPLSGPAILVSHGGLAFPDLDVILQGDGVTIDLVGNTNIKNNVTTSTFAAVPDAPISGFELNLPEGPYSALGANGNLCEQTLTMPTTIVGQNGVSVTQNTRIGVSGCPAVKVAVKKAEIKLGEKLVLTVKTSAAGRVTISGGGVRAMNGRLTAGMHQLAVALSAEGRIARRHRQKIRLRVGLQAARQAVTITTSVTL